MSKHQLLNSLIKLYIITEVWNYFIWNKYQSGCSFGDDLCHIEACQLEIIFIRSQTYCIISLHWFELWQCGCHNYSHDCQYYDHYHSTNYSDSYNKQASIMSPHVLQFGHEILIWVWGTYSDFDIPTLNHTYILIYL